MENIIIIFVLLLLLTLAITYMKKEKRKGIKCIGCPFAQNCSSCKGHNIKTVNRRVIG